MVASHFLLQPFNLGFIEPKQLCGSQFVCKLVLISSFTTNWTKKALLPLKVETCTGNKRLIFWRSLSRPDRSRLRPMQGPRAPPQQTKAPFEETNKGFKIHSFLSGQIRYHNRIHILTLFWFVTFPVKSRSQPVTIRSSLFPPAWPSKPTLPRDWASFCFSSRGLNWRKKDEIFVWIFLRSYSKIDAKELGTDSSNMKHLSFTVLRTFPSDR